ncbi:MAG TPA: DNA-formamidopyrimidine glycosylase [Thermosynechococcaceae cyanobacterium]
MPELPEVETIKRGLNQMTLHQTIQGGDVLLNRTIAHPVSVEGFLAGLQGGRITQWHRRGKYLLADLSPSSHLGVHLRMTGQLLWLDRDSPLQKHTRVRLFFEGGKELRFVDQRTFGQLWFVPPDQSIETVITGLQNLGPEPFSEDFSVDYFWQQLQRRRPIKNALLDQAIVAGVGNIYADEALFLSGIHPETLGIDLTVAQIVRLQNNIVEVLQASIAARGTTFSTFRNVEGVNGNYGNVAWVYARDGQACRTCETVIQRRKLAGRSAHFCPTCQEKG